MTIKYKNLNKKRLYNGFYKLDEFKFIHQKHNGSWTSEVTREIFGGAHVSSVLPYDPIKKKFLLLNQFRPGILSRNIKIPHYEIVAGMIDEGESPELSAKRECLEETGCKVRNLTKIHSFFPAPGSSESYYHIFFGEINSFEGERIKGLESENEDILVKSYELEEVRNLLYEKKIINGLTLIALQWFFLEYLKN